MGKGDEEKTDRMATTVGGSKELSVRATVQVTTAFISYSLVQPTSGVEDHISPRSEGTIVMDRTSFQTSVRSQGEQSASVHIKVSKSKGTRHTIQIQEKEDLRNSELHIVQ